MKPEDKKILYISIAMILSLGIVSFWRIKTFNPSNISFSFPSYDKIEVPAFDDIFSEENLEKISREINGDTQGEEKTITYTRHIIKEKIRIDCPSSWLITVEENINNDTKILFVAYADKAVYPSAIAVIEINKENIEDVVDAVTKETEKDGEISETLFEKVSEEEYFLRLSVVYPQKLKGLYTSKIFLINNIHYVVSVVSFDEKLSTPQDINDYIISSIQIIK